MKEWSRTWCRWVIWALDCNWKAQFGFVSCGIKFELHWSNSHTIIKLAEIAIIKSHFHVIAGYAKGPKGLTDEFYGFIKSQKCLLFVIYYYLKDTAFTAFKRDIKFYARYMYMKGYLFMKNGIRKGKGLGLRAEPTCIKIMLKVCVMQNNIYHIPQA